jgi:hypothetical protein
MKRTWEDKRATESSDQTCQKQRPLCRLVVQSSGLSLYICLCLRLQYPLIFIPTTLSGQDSKIHVAQCLTHS